ncbi:DoxX family protein [Buttiauxella warmboldiae]|uniref:DoxX family protein n=2 Tax=Buttiauxella warmboldiae TaxID=82993 RepID=A0A3N5DDQ5_9ENTR|nr:DoxX family protein [Buttiauxella warmboldiae]
MVCIEHFSIRITPEKGKYVPAPLVKINRPQENKVNKMKSRIYYLTILTGLVSFISAIAYIGQYDGVWSMVVMIIFSLLIPLSAWLWRKNRLISFMLTLFFTVIVVRNADQHDWSQVGWLTAITFIPLLIQAAIVFREGIEKYGTQEAALSFFRMFVGFNFLTHCTEKLFRSSHDAGLVSFFQNVVGMHTFGTVLSENFAVTLIVIGGLVELTSAILIGFGLLTRAGAFIAALYLVAAEVMSGHFGIGYTWMMPGGGWEFPFFYFMVTLPFLLPNSAGQLSLDHEWKLAFQPFLNLFSGVDARLNDFD